MYLSTTVLCLMAWMRLTLATDLHLMALVPMAKTGKFNGGVSVLNALEMALECINNRTDILPGYKLNLHWGDSKCSVGPAMNAMYEMLYQPRTNIMLLGGVCSHVCAPVAVASAIWNLTQIAYGCGSPQLSDKEEYPRFFRTLPDFRDKVDFYMYLMKLYGWNRIATIHQNLDLLSSITEKIAQRSQEENITVLTSEIFHDDPKYQVQNLKKHDARIIFLSSYEAMALEVFCEAYNQGLYGSHIQWFALSFYHLNWWKRARQMTSCSEAEILMVIQHIIYIGTAYVHPEETVTVSGEYRGEVVEQFHRRTNYSNPAGNNMLGAYYDAMWVAALALNITQGKLSKSGFTKSLEDFSYNDTWFANLITESAREVQFSGVQGEYNYNSDPILALNIFQQIAEEKRKVGYYLDFKVRWKNGGLQWKDGNPPSDSWITVYREVYVSTTLYVLVGSVATTGILLSLFFLVINNLFRQKRVIKMSSPNINSFILVGCMLAYTTVFFQQTQQRKGNALLFCSCRSFTFVVGFSLAYGALFAKTWRVHRILTGSKKLIQIRIRDSQLVSIVFGLVLVETLVLILAQVIDPVELITEQIPVQTVNRNRVTIYHISRCYSGKEIYFTGAIYIIQGIMMAFGAFLAWETRKVQVQVLNDSKLIGICIYNVLILSVLGVAINRAVDDVNTAYGFSSGFIIAGTTVTQCIIFIPKVVAIKQKENVVMSLGVPSNSAIVDTSKHPTSQRQLTDSTTGV